MSLEIRPLRADEVEQAEFIQTYSFNEPDRRDLARAVELAPRDPQALSEAIKALLADRTKLQRMGAAARDRAHSEFGIELMVDRILDLYSQVLQQPQRG